MDFIEFTGKTVDDALTNALVEFGVTSDSSLPWHSSEFRRARRAEPQHPACRHQDRFLHSCGKNR